MIVYGLIFGEYLEPNNFRLIQYVVSSEYKSSWKLSEFLWKNTIVELLTHFGKQMLERTSCGNIKHFEHDDYILHCHHHTSKYCIAVLTDKEYPLRIILSLLSEVLSENNIQKFKQEKETTKILTDVLSKYQNPDNFDRILKLRNQLDDVTSLLHENLDKLIQRGESIDSLIQKSTDISESSKTFYKLTRRSRCCPIL